MKILSLFSDARTTKLLWKFIKLLNSELNPVVRKVCKMESIQVFTF